ncbi:hypothetical protein HK097_010186 [Rhizophlyctis rosea]|uniref:SET domain-containing protein n=1 Tax=Rhizophlyctis rosea TaxID=64517 RepID=A0AAD5SAR3_9FUNG|nr:hypothetical protein HK097_010186 [Rhizophlyctis rosea]
MTTIYKHKHIDRRSSSVAGLGVFATKNIPAGTILTMDLVAVGTEPELAEFLDRDNVHLRGKVYPRGHDVRTIVKVLLNSFDDEPSVLGEYLSYYNHSCAPNAGLVRALGASHFFYMIVAVKAIKKREKIRIFYGYEGTHDEESAHFVNCKGCDAKEGDFVRWSGIAEALHDKERYFALFEAWQKQERTAVEKAILEKYHKAEDIFRLLPESTRQELLKNAKQN